MKPKSEAYKKVRAAKKEATMAEMEKRKKGALTKYNKKYCNDLIKHLKKGGSLESFGAYIGEQYGDEYAVSPSTVFNWLEEFPDFLEAREIGLSYSRKFYEDVGNSGMTGQLRRIAKEVILPNGKTEKHYAPASFNERVWTINMKNRFGFKDKMETEISNPDGSIMPNVTINIPSNGKEKKD